MRSLNLARVRNWQPDHTGWMENCLPTRKQYGCLLVRIPCLCWPNNNGWLKGRDVFMYCPLRWTETERLKTIYNHYPITKDSTTPSDTIHFRILLHHLCQYCRHGFCRDSQQCMILKSLMQHGTLECTPWGFCAGDRLQAGICVKNNSLITHKSAVGISFWNYAAYITDIGIWVHIYYKPPRSLHKMIILMVTGISSATKHWNSVGGFANPNQTPLWRK